VAVKMAIWRMTDAGPVPVESSQLQLERRLEDMVVAHPSITGWDLMIIGRQVTTAYGGFMDILGRVGTGLYRWTLGANYGFVGAGGGAWYSKPLRNLTPGSRVFAYVGGAGYVGIGEVVVRNPSRRAVFRRGELVTMSPVPTPRRSRSC